MSDDAAEELRTILDRASRDPRYAVECIDEARRVAAKLALAPYSSSKQYLPGTYLPATNIIEVTGIPAVAPGTTSPPIQIQIKTPGVVVGLMAATRPNGDSVERVGMSYQLTLEEMKSFVSNGEQTQGAFASFAGFSITAPWLPVMLPARGSGGWSVTFRNLGAAAVTPVFNLGFLQGEEALFRCFPAYRLGKGI
jgi:hypothetical protein